MRVIVTRHAMDRWQDRVSEYATARVEEVIQAVMVSCKIPDDEAIPFRKDLTVDYYFHELTGAYFITERSNNDTVRIISLIVPGMPDTPILHSKKKEKPVCGQEKYEQDQKKNYNKIRSIREDKFIQKWNEWFMKQQEAI